MGDRFYTQQKNRKRRLKKDVIANLNKLLGAEIKGLDRLTIATLEDLIRVIAFKNSLNHFEKAYKELADK